MAKKIVKSGLIIAGAAAALMLAGCASQGNAGKGAIFTTSGNHNAAAQAEHQSATMSAKSRVSCKSKHAAAKKHHAVSKHASKQASKAMDKKANNSTANASTHE